MRASWVAMRRSTNGKAEDAHLSRRRCRCAHSQARAKALDPIYSTGEHCCWRSAVIDVLVDAARTAGAAMVASMPITSKN